MKEKSGKIVYSALSKSIKMLANSSKKGANTLTMVKPTCALMDIRRAHFERFLNNNIIVN